MIKMDITYLELLYIVLIIFFIAVGTMLTLVLIKVNKILGTISNISGYANSMVEKIVMTLGFYKNIPDLVKKKVKDIFKK